MSLTPTFLFPLFCFPVEGIPSNLVVTPVGWRSLRVEFSAANQASASSYEYSVRNSATKVGSALRGGLILAT